MNASCEGEKNGKEISSTDVGTEVPNAVFVVHINGLKDLLTKRSLVPLVSPLYLCNDLSYCRVFQPSVNKASRVFEARREM